jgi:hypothetical protein
MLPFDPRRPDSKSVVSFDRGGLYDHPSTVTWHTVVDGRVIVPEVCIVGSTDAELDNGTDQALLADIALPGLDRRCTLEKSVDLHEKLRTLAPSFMRHAICLRQADDGFCEGVILMAALPNDQYPEGEGPTTYVKIDDFFVMQYREEALDVQTREVGEVGEWEIY